MNGILWFKHSPPNGPSVDLISPILIKQWFHFSTSSQAPLLGSHSAAWLVSQHMQIWIKGGRTTRQRRVCWYPSQCEARGPSHHRWEKEIGGPSRPSAYYPEASFGACQSHIGTCTHTRARACTRTCRSKPLHPPPPHSMSCEVKDVFGLLENKNPNAFTATLSLTLIAPSKTCQRGHVFLIRLMGNWSVKSNH